jgi:hypothetical protein
MIHIFTHVDEICGKHNLRDGMVKGTPLRQVTDGRPAGCRGLARNFKIILTIAA